MLFECILISHMHSVFTDESNNSSRSILYNKLAAILLVCGGHGAVIATVIFWQIQNSLE